MSKRTSEELSALIRRELERGIPEEKIKKVLSRKGYDNKEIKRIFENAGKKEGMTKRYFAILVILVIGVAAASVLEPRLFPVFEPPEPPSSEHPLVPSPQIITCSSDADCANILCTQVVGQDTPLCNSDTGQCFCGAAETERKIIFESVGDPDAISYMVNTPTGENIAITEEQVLSLTCLTEGDLICREPVLHTFSVENLDDGSSRYEQWVYFKIENKDPSAAKLTNAEINGKTGFCLVPFVPDITLGRGLFGGPIVSICSDPTNPLVFEGEVTLTYLAGGTEKQSSINLQTS